ncbi:ABC transporter permease [Bifidobacterium samirii]|uniref:ABC transporter permease n=1 Tax=Bifidobacterium samirii TaxID=2306974 RepID=A0A430FWN2_9BIFI|nr:ABC transporter permease [Bifidobacterium samirii]RSX58771.1 ABC transporter permease [Bifidobacterium samirii]
MSAALILVRLRWALTWAALRKSVWQTVGYVIALALAAGTVIMFARAAIDVGSLPAELTIPDGPTLPLLGAGGLLHVGVVLAGTLATVFIAFVQLMLLGEGSTMNPRKFALYGIPDHRLQFGLLLAGLSGLPAICGVLSLLAWAGAYRRMGAAAVVAGVVAAPVAVLTMMSIAKALIAAATTLVNTRRGRNVFYMVTVLLFVALFQVPSIALSAGIDDGMDLADAIAGMARGVSILAWTPLGAAYQLPFDAAAGAWGALAGRLVLLAATWVACYLIGVWCLRRDRLTAGAGGGAVKTKGVGAFAWMPDSPSGAVSARLLTFLRRDPRQAMLFAMPLFFAAIFAFQAHAVGEPMAMWVALPFCGWVMSITESNGVAYDGRGFAMQVICGVDGVTDRIGRVRVYTGIIVAYMLILFVVIAVVTGDWARPDRLLIGALCAAIGIDAGLCGLGMAEITSCTLMYPVPSMDKPFSSPQGRALAQGFFPLIYMIGGILLLAPTGITALAMLFTGAIFDWYGALIPVSLLNGAAVAALGTWLGGKLLDARMLAVMRNLESFASLQQ